MMRAVVASVFEKSSRPMCKEAIVWLSDQYFKRIRLNEDFLMGDQCVINEYKLSQMPYHDIELLKNLFDQTDFGAELEEEYKKRSTS